MTDGEEIPYEDFGKGRWTVEKVGFDGPIKRQWFDDKGNYHTLYENGAYSVISHDVLEDVTHQLKDSDGI